MATLLTRPDGVTGPASGDAPGAAAAGRGLPPVERVHWATVCLGFLALTLSQQPGRIVPDTKLDLTIDPWGFLGRALQLWEPEGFAGQVQNQAYGYLFPMGPFFGVGTSAGIPEWIVQRLWMALLFGLAFVGVAVLARQLGIGTPGARLIGALAYALAPRMLMGMGATSIEVLPMALAPWVLVPLVAGARGGSPRRAAALSGLAVFCVGGVNAVATSAVLPLAALFLLTRPAGPRRRRLAGWWAASVALATAWWVGPLLLLREYSPPFLDYIETAATTTATTGLLSTLRGTSQWVAYLVDGEGPIWPIGATLVHDLLPVLATVVLAAAGLLGLSRPSFRDRGWLVLGLLAGLALVTMGHLGTVQGVLAGPLHEALDGVLAPMRNVHKYDPVLRLPLALGVAHLGGLLLARLGRGGRAVHRTAARGGVVLVVLALVTTVSPAVAGRLSPPTGFEEIPGYWEQTAEWLADAEPAGRALLLPASSFGTYVWGTTADEPLQALADSPWTVRSAVPLSATAHIRVLNAVEERLARGEGSAGLAGYLARAGISHVVLRNDLDSGAVGSIRPVLAQQALRESPGLRRVAAFGPLVPESQVLAGRVLDAFLVPRRPAVEIYAVADPAPRAYAVPLADAVAVVGGPDALLALEDRGLVAGRPALLAGEAAAPGSTTMVADTQIRRERAYGRTADAVSAGLTADDPRRLPGPERDYRYPGSELAESVVRFDGGAVSASSSAADADSVRGARVGDQPFAAVDGDPTTAWRPAERVRAPRESWWRLDTDRPLAADTVVVRLTEVDGTLPERLVLTTETGTRTVPVAATTGPQRLALPAGSTSSLTIGATGADAAVLALAEVEVPGVPITRTVVVPAPARPAAVYAFDAAHPAGSGCAVESGERPRCSPALVRAAEETAGIDRTLTVVAPATYTASVVVEPRPGAALDALIGQAARPGGAVVTASSTAVPDPRAGGDAAFDGDLRTVWLAAADDPLPSLTITWPEPRTIDRLRVETPTDSGASLPAGTAAISVGGLEQTVSFGVDGVAEFAPVTTDRLTVSFPLRREVTSFDPYTRALAPLGLGIAELEVDGVPAGDPGAVVELPCGAGPVVEVDGTPRQTALRTTLSGLRTLEPVDLTFCGAGASTVPLAAGEHRFLARSTDAFAVVSVTLVREGSAGGAPRRTAVETGVWDREHRTVRVGERAEATLLVVPESVNPGWAAALDGRALETRTVDGWQQGYLLPAGPAGEVVLDFRPGAVYHAALTVGAGALVVLLAVLLVPGRGTPPPATGTRRRAGGGTVLAAVAGVAVVGGPAGLVALAAAAGLGRLAGLQRRRVLGGLAGGGLAAAGLVSVSAEGPAGAVQVLALVSVCAVVAALLPDAGAAGARPGTRWRHRRRGRSTSR